MAWIAGADADGATGPAGLSATPGIGTMFQALRRRWPLILGLSLLGGVLAGAAVWLLVPGKYTTEMLLEFERPPRGSYEGEFDVPNFKRAQTALLKGNAVVQKVVDKAEVRQFSEVRRQADPALWLQKSLVTDDLLGPTILRVTLSGNDPEEVQTVLNELRKEYLAAFAAAERAKIANRTRSLQESYRACATSLRAKRQAMAKKREALGLDEPETMTVRYQAALKQLEDAKGQRLPLWLRLKGAEAELVRERARSRAPQDLEVPDSDMEEELARDPVVKAQVDRLAAVDVAIQQIKGAAKGATRDAALQGPLSERQAIEQRLEALVEHLRPRIRRRLQDKAAGALKANVAKLEMEIHQLREQKKTLDAEIKRLEPEVENIRFVLRSPDKLPPDLLAMKDDVDQTEQALKKIGEELATLQVGATSPRVNIIESPKVPQSADLKRPIKTAGAASLGMFGLIFLGVTMLESRKRRVYAADDVVHGLGIHLVGTLPALPARTRKALPGGGGPQDVYWQNIMTESVDVIRTVLLHSAHVEALRVVMVTSAVGGEGKTSLASHLAASLARAWRKTLLVDCDLRNPAAHQQFNVPLEPGLSEVLRGEVELDDAVRPTPVSRLWLMPAGKWDSHSIQALAQPEVGALFGRLQEQYDFIVMDACPVLPVADSMLVGQHADAVLFSVLRDVSRMPAVYAAHQRLAALGIRMLGAVVIGEKPDGYGQDSKYLGQVPS
jgi:capsular exopolysaccharide synthesis family protein